MFFGLVARGRALTVVDWPMTRFWITRKGRTFWRILLCIKVSRRVGHRLIRFINRHNGGECGYVEVGEKPYRVSPELVGTVNSLCEALPLILNAWDLGPDGAQRLAAVVSELG